MESKGNVTVIEYRCAKSKKLNEAYLEGPEHYVQSRIDSMYKDGDTNIIIVRNPNNYNLTLNPCKPTQS